MTDPQTQRQPLIGAPSQETAINVVGTPAVGGSSSRAYKIAGFTLLACLLVAGQALTAYFVLSQRSDIKSLEEQGNNLRSELKKGRVAAVPMQIHMPMNVMPKLIDDTTEEGVSTEAPRQGPDKATECQLEAAGLKPVPLASFRPSCDEWGLYRAQQCWMGQRCWCVDTTTGQEIPGTLTVGPARCHGAASASGSVGGLTLNRVMALPDALELSDD